MRHPYACVTGMLDGWSLLTLTLPSGREVDLNTLTGMTTYTAYLQFLEAHKEMIDNVFVFVKNLENKLDNLLSS